MDFRNVTKETPVLGYAQLNSVESNTIVFNGPVQSCPSDPWMPLMDVAASHWADSKGS